MHLKSPCHCADMGLWLVFEVFQGFEGSLQDSLPFLIGQDTKLCQCSNRSSNPCSTQWGKVSWQMAIKLPSVQRLTCLCKSCCQVSSSVCEGASCALTPSGICPAVSSSFCDSGRPGSQEPSVGNRNLAVLKEPFNCPWIMVQNHLSVAKKSWAAEKKAARPQVRFFLPFPSFRDTAGETICKTTDSILRM